MFLVVYSERGLVVARAPNLQLFNIIYIVVVTVEISFKDEMR